MGRKPKEKTIKGPPAQDAKEKSSLWIAVVGALATILVAVFGYLEIRHQIDAPIQATQTAQAAVSTSTPLLLLEPPTSPGDCPPADGLTFESDSLSGWQIRYEGTTLLGESLKLEDDIPCTSPQNAALAFEFQVLNYKKAQIGLEGKNLPLAMEMTAWVYNPPDGPGSLAAQCYVLTGPEAGWKWYDTAPARLPAGEWTRLSCPISEFRPNSGWVNPPLFIGLQFYDTEAKPYLTTVYIDNISIK